MKYKLLKKQNKRKQNKTKQNKTATTSGLCSRQPPPQGWSNLNLIQNYKWQNFD